MSELRIGISGWSYIPWRGTFFPADLAHRLELEFASREVNSIEINGTFYSLQSARSFVAWKERTPPGFLFSVKCPRFITHMKRLKDVARPLANFFASGVLALDEKLGPLLWQLPPRLAFDAARLTEFFQMLPRDTAAASELARTAEPRIIPEPWTKLDTPRPLRHALEVRHDSFRQPAAIELLRAHGIALVVADTAGKWPFLEDITADFIYIRLHGDAQLYVSGYSQESLENWARKIRIWQAGDDPGDARRVLGPSPHLAEGRSIYAYFDNDVKTRAPYDAMSLAHFLGLNAPPSPEAAAAAAAASAHEEPRTEWPAYISPRKKKPAATTPESIAITAKKRAAKKAASKPAAKKPRLPRKAAGPK